MSFCSAALTKHPDPNDKTNKASGTKVAWFGLVWVLVYYSRGRESMEGKALTSREVTVSSAETGWSHCIPRL